MAESKRDGGQEPGVLHRKRNGILTLCQILFSANIACALGYALVVYISRNQGLWTPQNDSTYFFLRSAYRIDDLLRLNSTGAIFTREVARKFPSQWSQAGSELLVLGTAACLTALILLLLRLVVESWLYSDSFRREGKVTALFAAPACYLYVSKLTWSWAQGPLSQPSYSFWQSSPLILFVVEIFCLGIFRGVYRKRSIPAWTLNFLLFLHYGIWCIFLWTPIGVSMFKLYSPYVLLLAFPLSGIIWLFYCKGSDTGSIGLTEHRRTEVWTYLAAISATSALVLVWLPRTETSLTHPKSMESLTIQMSRGPCYGTCPVYTIAIHGNGLVEYAGGRFVKDRGQETSAIGREQIIAVLQSLERAHFSTLEDRAFTWCFDSPSVAISVSLDGRTKHVVSDRGCIGAKSGVQAQFVRATDEIDAMVDSNRWVSCDTRCQE